MNRWGTGLVDGACSDSEGRESPLPRVPRPPEHLSSTACERGLAPVPGGPGGELREAVAGSHCLCPSPEGKSVMNAGEKGRASCGSARCHLGFKASRGFSGAWETAR